MATATTRRGWSWGWGLCLLTLALGAGQQAEEAEEARPTARVAQGVLRGVRVRSPVARPFMAFRGVPYASPPLGARRFRDAEPAASWEGERDASREGSQCTQLSWETGQLEGDEDCLYLNVYTPRMPPADPLPVLVWIHGGGFVFGSGGARDYGPDYLLEEDVVVVTFNYRLSCLGFLLLGEAAPGNAGMKDQVLALRWVRDNIAAFNGDPARVTISGQSAGAESVQYHMLSPLSQGLFHGAIAMSGAAVNAYMHAPYETSRRLADAVGCDGGDDDDALLDCLRGVDARRLVRAAETQAPTPRDRARLMLFSFYPTAEELRVRGVETFVVAPPQQLAARGCHARVPYMTGLTDAEWMLVEALNASVWSDEATLRRLDADWPAFVVPETRLRPDDTRLPQAERDLRDFFLDGGPLDARSLPGYQDMFSDMTGGESTYFTIYHMAEADTSPVYYYAFTVDDELNFLKYQFNLSSPGAAHADDLGYLFHVPRLPAAAPDSVAARVRRRLVRLHANFIKFGEPTPADDPLLGARWAPYTRRRRAHLVIGADALSPGEDLDARRVAFWQRFYRTYGAKGLRPAVVERCPAAARASWLAGWL